MIKPTSLVAILLDHNHLIFPGEWNDVDPGWRFDYEEIVLPAGPWRTGPICSKAEDAV